MGRDALIPSLIAIVILAVTFYATAWVTAPTFAPEIEQVQASDSQQIAVLRTELAEVRSANERLLTIVVWTLGIVAAVTTIFISFNYSQYRHVAEKERAADKKDLQDSLSASLDSQVRDLARKVNEDAARQIKQIQLDVKQAELARMLDQPLVGLIGALLALKVAEDIRKLQEEQYPDSVRYRISDHHTNEILDQIESILTEPNDPFPPPSSWELNEIDAAVSALPDLYAASRERILALIRDPQRQTTKRQRRMRPRPTSPVSTNPHDLTSEKDRNA